MATEFYVSWFRSPERHTSPQIPENELIGVAHVSCQHLDQSTLLEGSIIGGCGNPNKGHTNEVFGMRFPEEDLESWREGRRAQHGETKSNSAGPLSAGSLYFERGPESGFLTNPLEQIGKRGSGEVRKKPRRTLA